MQTGAKKYFRMAGIVRTVDLDECLQCGTDHKSRNVPVTIQAFNSCVFEAFCFLSFFPKKKDRRFKGEKYSGRSGRNWAEHS